MDRGITTNLSAIMSRSNTKRMLHFDEVVTYTLQGDGEGKHLDGLQWIDESSTPVKHSAIMQEEAWRSSQKIRWSPSMHHAERVVGHVQVFNERGASNTLRK